MQISIWKRTAAFILDIVIISGLFVMAIVVFDALFNSSSPTLISLINSCKEQPVFETVREYKNILIWYAVVFLIICLSYEFFFLNSRISASPGKYVLGLKVSFRQKTICFVFLRAILKFLLLLTLLGGGIEFLFVYIDRKRRSLHDFAAGTMLVLQDSKLERDVPKGLWFFILVAVLSLTPYYFTNKLARDSFTEIKYSEVIAVNNIGKELYEGVWVNNKKWMLTFTYLSDRLYIYDSNYFFRDFKYQLDNKLVCVDRDGNNYIFVKKDNQLIATHVKDKTVRYYEFDKKEKT